MPETSKRDKFIDSCDDCPERGGCERAEIYLPSKEKFDKAYLLIQQNKISPSKELLDKAKKLLMEALDIMPEEPSALNNLADIYMQEGDLEEAEKYIKRALTNEKHYQFPDDVYPVLNATNGEILELKGNLKDAQSSFMTALFMNPSNPKRYRDLARIIKKQLWQCLIGSQNF